MLDLRGGKSSDHAEGALICHVQISRCHSCQRNPKSQSFFTSLSCLISDSRVGSWGLCEVMPSTGEGGSAHRRQKGLLESSSRDGGTSDRPVKPGTSTRGSHGICGATKGVMLQ